MSHTPPATPLNTQSTDQSPQQPSTTTSDMTALLAERLSTELGKLCAALASLSTSPVEDSNSQPHFDALHSHPDSQTGEILTSVRQQTSLPEVDWSMLTGPLPTESGGPFIRLVTHGHGTLVHLGQLVGILDDHSAFLLQRVVSFDPTRVQLHMLANLKPADILLLTESKLQQRRHKRERALKGRDGNLLSSLITTAQGLESERHSAKSSVPSGEAYNNNCPTMRHGPVLTTPGLVLIRADQVRELGIISENGAAGTPWMPDLVDLDLSGSGEVPSQSTDEQTSVTDGQPATQQEARGCQDEAQTTDASCIVSGLNERQINATSTVVKKSMHGNVNDDEPERLRIDSHQSDTRSTGTVHRDRQRGAESGRVNQRRNCGACGGSHRDNRRNRMLHFNRVMTLEPSRVWIPSQAGVWNEGNRSRYADGKQRNKLSMQPRLIAYDAGIAFVNTFNRRAVAANHQFCCCDCRRTNQQLQWRRTCCSRPRGRNRGRFSPRQQQTKSQSLPLALQANCS
ncbi:unnamed protein product [Dicrocoelium dendriticum]|nr:unnamed protein product [Dicrocoelium dendriticum]